MWFFTISSISFSGISLAASCASSCTFSSASSTAFAAMRLASSTRILNFSASAFNISSSLNTGATSGNFWILSLGGWKEFLLLTLPKLRPAAANSKGSRTVKGLENEIDRPLWLRPCLRIWVFFWKSEMNLLLVNYNVAVFSALEWVHGLHTFGWILEKVHGH